MKIGSEQNYGVYPVRSRSVQGTLRFFLLYIFAAWLPFCPSRVESSELDPLIRKLCFTILQDGITGDDFWPAMHAAEAMTLSGKGGEVRDRLGRKLDSEKDDQRRCGLARELVRAGDPAKSEVMLEILQSADPHGHVHAAESLYKVGFTGDDTPLKNAFHKTEDIRLKLMAAAALAKHSRGATKERALGFLRDHLKTEPDPTMFRLSAWVLGRIGSPKDCELIRMRLPDTNDAAIRAFLEHALAALGDPKGKVAVLRNLKSPDPAVRTYAAVFAGESEILEAIPLLIIQLKDTNPDARIRAAQALLVLVP